VTGNAAPRARNVLVLAYDFLPCRAPGAAVRTVKFVHYLPEFGWQPTVLCRDDRPEGGGRRGDGVLAVTTRVPERLSYQAAAWAWAARIERIARRLLREAAFDLLYASGPPFAHALAAARLSRAFSLPLVVDFRDAWSLDPFEGGTWPKRFAKRALCRWVYPHFERRVFRAADALVSNTPSMAAAHQTRAQRCDGVHTMVPNGFDAADFAEPEAHSDRSERVVFLHCGRFDGVAGRSAETLLRALRMVADTGRPVTLHVLGDQSATLRRQVRRFGVQDLVDLASTVPHEDAVRAMRRADILVLYQAAGRGPVTPVAGKTFEYLRSGRPVLAIVPPGDNGALVRAHARHHRLVSPEDLVAVAGAMCELADAHPIATCEPGPAFAQYERRVLTARLAEVFDRAFARRAVARAGSASP
jgi:glycosyltransferase involved in cell wall biosynthesis